MNYANMIEEKNLKKTFIIATLCSTLVGTFTSSIGLWDRVGEKRKQKKRDVTQDKEIKELRDRVDSAEKRPQGRDSSRPRDDSRPRDPRDSRNDVVGDSLERSGALISREFDEGFARLGRRFAVGDAITENRLQAQVIALQQTVINVLQDALYSGRQLDDTDKAKLLAASNSARDGSLDALRQQRQRQLEATEGPPQPEMALGPPKRASTIIDADPLYCRYSLDLQYIRNKPLAATFAPGGSCRCPDCGVRVDVESDDFWEIDKRTPRLLRTDSGYEREVIEEREFHLGQRFVVKCHTPDGEFACVLCSRHRDRDAICPTVKALVNHVGRFHNVGELANEMDFETRARTLPLALPAPSRD